MLQNIIYMYKKYYITLHLYSINYTDRLYKIDNKFFNLACLLQ